MNGLSLHQISKSNYPYNTQGFGNPDYIFWVNEIEETFGVSERPTGEFDGNVKYPGGAVAYDQAGHIWYTFGGRAGDLPGDIFKSDAPYDVNSFTKKLDDLDTYNTSTSLNLHAADPDLFVFWRHGHSGGVDTTVRLRRYDMESGFDVPELEIDIGRGVWDDVLGQTGIEQLYTRYDPRYGYLFVTWQWFYVDDNSFGSYPFLYSDDLGNTWKLADGSVQTDLPLDYSEITPLQVPHNHLALGENTSWWARDIGISPNGVFWLAIPSGDVTIEAESWIDFWFFNGTEWESRRLTEGMHWRSKAHACAATKDRLCFVYSDSSAYNALKAIVSEDDGATWSRPVVVDTVADSEVISWVSYAQPAHDYADNTARFFYAYYRSSDGNDGRRFRNNIRWTKLDLDQINFCPADLNGDSVVDVDDMFAILMSWGECDECPADLNHDGVVDIQDLFIVLDMWGSCYPIA
ncbi:MAG: GC-type dockerin domain-anchored protein, partial [Actinomycetota bacterium]|nr:GC-type dockerin domain-anchored protein [Actinomycetota bacterium]